jgi:hypothetical protein
MINAPDRRTFISGLGTVTAGLKVGRPTDLWIQCS